MATSSSRGLRVVRLAAILSIAVVSPCLARASSGAAPAPDGPGKVYLTVEEALKLTFPGCTVERTTAYLTRGQLDRARALSGSAIESGLAYAYVARSKDGAVCGTAYFDTHRVRTLAETLMVAIDPKGEVRRVELLAFAEPQEYAPRAGWYAQFNGRMLDEELNLKRGIRGVTGATLSARATTEAVRRVLAVHRVLHEAPTQGDR